MLSRQVGFSCGCGIGLPVGLTSHLFPHLLLQAKGVIQLLDQKRLPVETALSLSDQPPTPQQLATIRALGNNGAPPTSYSEAEGTINRLQRNKKIREEQEAQLANAFGGLRLRS
jgi:hypothetical protein